MFRCSVATGAVLVGAAMVLAQPAQATPQEDQFLNSVMMYLNQSYQPSDEDMVVGMGHDVCYMLNQGYNSSEAIRQAILAAPWSRAVVRDSIGFALVATTAFCPQYSHLFEGV